MSRMHKATEAFFYSCKDSPVTFTVCAWGPENAAPDGEPAYEGGGTLNVNPRRLLLEPEFVAEQIRVLKAPWPRPLIDEAVTSSRAKLRSQWQVESDGDAYVITLASRSMRVMKDSLGIDDLGTMGGQGSAFVRDRLLAQRLCDLADQITADPYG